MAHDKHYPGDQALNLSDCPFPTRQGGDGGWRVVEFGKNERHDQAYAIVRYKKRCGHTTEERISFIEGEKDFTHYKTLFRGDSYSINAWKDRIPYFQNNLLCGPCQMSYHRWWICRNDSWDSKEHRVKSLIPALDYAYPHWRKVLSLEEDFPNLRIGHVWRPDNLPEPNTFYSPLFAHEKVEEDIPRIES